MYLIRLKHVFLLATSILLLNSNSMQAEGLNENGEWGLKLSKDLATVYVRPRKEGAMLEDVIEQVDIKRLRNVSFYVGSTPFSGEKYAFEDQFQQDFFTYLQKHYPEELGSALRSSGNVHNPRITGMGEQFKEAIFNSQIVQKIDLLLNEKEAFISSVSYEKLFIDTRDPSAPTVSAIIWIKVSEKPTSGN